MHRPIMNGIEEYLSGTVKSEDEREIEEHLASCEQCRRTVTQMRRQSDLLKVLRSDDEITPAPGFYARVLDRIDLQRAPSVWDLFLEPVFGRRLTYAAVTMFLLLGTLMVTSNRWNTATPAYYSSPEMLLAEEPVSQYIGDDPDHDREVVLVNLATYRD